MDYFQIYLNLPHSCSGKQVKDALCKHRIIGVKTASAAINIHYSQNPMERIWYPATGTANYQLKPSVNPKHFSMAYVCWQDKHKAVSTSYSNERGGGRRDLESKQLCRRTFTTLNCHIANMTKCPGLVFTPVSACASFKPAICLRVGQLLETWSIYFYLAVMEWSICSSPGAFHVASSVTHKPGTLLNGISFITADEGGGRAIISCEEIKNIISNKGPRCPSWLPGV